jgi:hypothetical protein
MVPQYPEQYLPKVKANKREAYATNAPSTVNLRQMKRTDMIHMNPTLKLEVD